MSGGAAISIDLERLGKRFDIAQDALDAQAWADIQQYMPMNTGNLIRETNILNNSVRGVVYAYPPDSDYGHYQHEGILYVDPKYEVGAFYAEDYGYWSRPGIEKIPSDRKLKYTTTHHPDACAHWEDTAYRNHKKEWVKVAKRAVRGE